MATISAAKSVTNFLGPGLLLTGLLFMNGCGSATSKSSTELIGVDGRVTVNGTPLANASVTFTPTGAGGASIGVTDENGNYKLYYGPSAVGAVPGNHRVTIEVGDGEDVVLPPGVDAAKLTPRQLNEAYKKARAASVIPAEYQDGRKPLAAIVAPAGGAINFDLTS